MWEFGSLTNSKIPSYSIWSSNKKVVADSLINLPLGRIFLKSQAAKKFGIKMVSEIYQIFFQYHISKL